MKFHVLIRKIHYWVSLIVALPLFIMIAAGLVLMLKKDVGWVQPPSRHAAFNGVPAQSVADLFVAAAEVEKASIHAWTDLARADIKPDKGIIKFVSKTDWEVQVSLQDASVLQVAKRRSDWIEQLHDGSFFSKSVKYYIFLPAGISLLFMWASGLYLFIRTEMKKRINHTMKGLAAKT